MFISGTQALYNDTVKNLQKLWNLKFRVSEKLIQHIKIQKENEYALKYPTIKLKKYKVKLGRTGN